MWLCSPPLLLATMKGSTALSERSAVSRVPVELWDAIITNAIDYTLSPTSSDGLVEAFYRLQEDPLRNTAYGISERLRLALRLVCKTWSAIANRHERRFYAGRLSSIRSDYNEWYKRMELLPQPYAWIQAPEMTSNHLFATVSSSSAPPVMSFNCHRPSTASRHQPVVVREWIAGDAEGAPSLRVLCNKHPNLKVLAHCLIFKEFEAIPSIELGRLQHLTYLAIYNVTALCLTVNTCIHMPTLHTLYLDFNCDDQGLSINPLLTWNIPSLKYLGTWGNWEAENDFFFQTWIHLLQDNGSRLLGLSIAGGMLPGFMLREEFWSWCPALRTIALETSYFGNVDPPSDQHLPLEIVLLDQAWSKLYSYEMGPDPGNFLENLHRWRAGSAEGLRLPVSWANFGELMAEGQTSLQSFWKELLNGMLPLIQERMWTFKDRLGVEHTDEKARKAFNILGLAQG